jgi:hypothetical protein
MLSSLGLGVDLAGASILAIGLLAAPVTLGAQATAFWDFSPQLGAAGARARVDAEVGLSGLVLGIGLQIAGVAFPSTPPRGLIALSAVGGGLLVFGVWSLIRDHRLRQLIVEIARAREADDGSGCELAPLPNGARLMSLGRAAGWEWLGATESVQNYAERNFGLHPDEIDISGKPGPESPSS